MYFQPRFESLNRACSCPQVALQFPDDLLVDSIAIVAEIERNTDAKVFILGDTSYGR